MMRSFFIIEKRMQKNKAKELTEAHYLAVWQSWWMTSYWHFISSLYLMV